jgi:carbamoyltransferase
MKPPKVILGIGYGSHDSSAALLIDGRLVAACEEERYNLVKHTNAFPINAARECLALHGLTIDNVDIVCPFFLLFFFSLFSFCF